MEATLEHGGAKIVIPMVERGKDRPFKSGATGFQASFKLEDGKERYQVSINAVLIGSRPE